MATRKATLVLSEPPTLRVGKVILAYVIDAGEKGRETVRYDATLADDLRPINKADTLAAAAIFDACDGWVKQELRAEFAAFRAEQAAWRTRLEQATEAGDGAAVVRLMKSPPVKPDVSDATAERIKPFVQFMTLARAAWAGASKYTLRIFGSGEYGKTIIWTGTLSSLTGKRPASGTIALGRKVR